MIQGVKLTAIITGLWVAASETYIDKLNELSRAVGRDDPTLANYLTALADSAAAATAVSNRGAIRPREPIERGTSLRHEVPAP